MNSSVLFSYTSYAKRYYKTFSGIGPFFQENSKPIEENEAEALKHQYEMVLSVPDEEAKRKL